MLLVEVDNLKDKIVVIDKDFESLYLKIRNNFESHLKIINNKFYMIEYQDCFLIDIHSLILELLILMTETDLTFNFEIEINFESIHKFYIRNLLFLYQLSDCNELFLLVDVLKEVQRIYKKEVE